MIPPEEGTLIVIGFDSAGGAHVSFDPDGGGGDCDAELLTVTVTLADDVLPAASRATAVGVCCPFADFVVSQAAEYGDEVSSLPRAASSSSNWTPATPTLSLAEPATEMEPETVAPDAGAVSATD